MHLDFVIVSNRGPEFYPRIVMTDAFRLAGIELAHRHVPEEVLRTGRIDGQAIPEQALLYVHGDYNGCYENVTVVRTLASPRADLRFIVHVDPVRHAEREFVNSENYQLLRESLERGLHPQYQIGISPHEPVEFFTGKSRRSMFQDPIDFSLETYLQELKILRGSS